MKPASYIIQVQRVEFVTFWRGRKRVHWTRWKSISRCESPEEAVRGARSILRQGAGLTIARITHRGQTVWVGDGQSETHRGEPDRWALT
jgi:hypothetical protein